MKLLRSQIVSLVAQMSITFGEAYFWLITRPRKVDFQMAYDHLTQGTRGNRSAIGDLVRLIHYLAPDEFLVKVARNKELYSLPRSVRL